MVNLKYIRKLESEIKNMTSGGCLIVGVVIENGEETGEYYPLAIGEPFTSAKTIGEVRGMAKSRGAKLTEIKHPKEFVEAIPYFLEYNGKSRIDFFEEREEPNEEESSQDRAKPRESQTILTTGGFASNHANSMF